MSPHHASAKDTGLAMKPIQLHQMHQVVLMLFIVFCAYRGTAIATVQDGVITVTGIQEIDKLAILGPEYFEMQGSTCHIKVPLLVKGVLRATNEHCDAIYLYPQTYLEIAGSAYFDNVIISSYDPLTKSPLILTYETYNQYRPYILMLFPGKSFYARNTEFSHLGYYNDDGGKTWGLAFYDLEGTADELSVEIQGSRMHQNYFGFYTFNVKHASITDSKVYDNLEYGLDFHDYSDFFYIARNEIYNNGNHALIFSKYCENNTITNNVIWDHTTNVFVKGEFKDYGTHGIMLHHTSDGNIIEGNVIQNTRTGIYLEDSSDNLVINNLIINDHEDGIYISHSHNNEVRNNQVQNSGRYGLYSYFSYNNVYTGNSFDDGIYIKGEENGTNYRVLLSGPEYDDAEVEYIIAQELKNKHQKIYSFGIGDSIVATKLFFILGLAIVLVVVIALEVVIIIVRKSSWRKDGKRI